MILPGVVIGKQEDLITARLSLNFNLLGRGSWMDTMARGDRGDDDRRRCYTETVVTFFSIKISL